MLTRTAGQARHASVAGSAAYRAKLRAPRPVWEPTSAGMGCVCRSAACGALTATAMATPTADPVFSATRPRSAGARCPRRARSDGSEALLRAKVNGACCSFMRAGRCRSHRPQARVVKKDGSSLGRTPDQNPSARELPRTGHQNDWIHSARTPADRCSIERGIAAAPDRLASLLRVKRDVSLLQTTCDEQ